MPMTRTRRERSRPLALTPRGCVQARLQDDRSARGTPDSGVSSETDDGGAPDPGLNGSMTDIGTFFPNRGRGAGPNARFAEKDTALAESFSDQAHTVVDGFWWRVTRA